jgi:hypothetical protein
VANQSNRDWREIAAELVAEKNEDRISILAAELYVALAKRDAAKSKNAPPSDDLTHDKPGPPRK